MIDYNDLIGRPFSEEFNCWELCREMSRRNGQNFPKYAEFISDFVERKAFIDDNIENDFVKLDKPEPGCIVFIRLPGLLHIGYVISEKHFIHVRQKMRTTVDRLDKWSGLIDGFWRYTGN